MSDITINAKVPSVNVTAAPQSNVITPKIQIVGGGASITVDDALSLTSENPVQNKVITSALNEKAPIIINTASGEIASIPDGADDMPMRSLVANIEPVQEGSGDPSPTNIRPISGWTGANIYQEAVYDESATPKLSISWESEAGTVYGGTLNVTTGVLTVDMAMVDLGLLNWRYNQTLYPAWPFFTAYVQDKKNGWNNGLMEEYNLTKTIYDRLSDFCFNCTPYQSSANVNIRDSRYTDTASFKAAMSGKKYIYELVTPITYTLTPEQVGILTTIYGSNNVWADTGDVEVKYPADTKLYIDNLIASLSS